MRFTISIFCLLIFLTTLPAQSRFKLLNPVFPIPSRTPVVLTPAAHIGFPPIRESSGIVKSRLWKNVYWTFNDSGDRARIFAIDSLGQIIKPHWASRRFEGIEIPDAVNVDWEDIATDDSGNLYIADIGNNDNTRRDQTIYVVKEPYPWATEKTNYLRKIHLYFPDQKNIPPARKNFDAEAIFWKAGKLYILTKHRSDTYTTLYRLDKTDPNADNPLTRLGRFNILGMVTAADISPDGQRVAVLTYTGIWLFEMPPDNDNFLTGKKFALPIIAKQCEGITFDGDVLVLTNEQRDIFRVKTDELIPVE